METPSSARRVTRSQAAALKSSTSKLGSGERLSRTRAHRFDRLALLDITNDSPIVGVTLGASESNTPASSIRKTVPRPGAGDTPCSGENLLRCQVKTLLQSVEEESEFPKLENQHLYLQKLCLVGRGLVSPAGLLAPTPANTPEIFPNVPLDGNPVENGSTFQLHEACDGLNVDTVKPMESPVTRALTFDSPEKSEAANSVASIPSSVLYYQEKATDDDDCSEWSVRVNVSSKGDEDEDDDFNEDRNDEFEEENEDELDEDNGEIDDGLCEELCRELSKISMQESHGLPRFEGIHTRFIYNSDDEIEEEEVEVKSFSPNVLHLKGLPTPKGKHVRFPDDELIAKTFSV